MEQSDRGAESMAGGSGEPTPSEEPLILIVADTAEQRLALSAGIPAEAPILLASDISEARRVLAQLPGAAGRGGGAKRRPPRGATPGHAERRLVTGSQITDQDVTARALRLREDRLSLTMGEAEVHLTRLEFALLRYLLPRIGQVASFEQLSQVGWRTAYLGNGAHMHAAIGRLRTKLAEIGAPLIIEAVRGHGFRLVQHPRAGVKREALGS